MMVGTSCCLRAALNPPPDLHFNPTPRVQLQPLLNGAQAVVIDDALTDPQGLVDWAAHQAFAQPVYPYPGVVHDMPPQAQQRMQDFFLLHVRQHLGVRRVQDLALRLSLATTPPDELAPVQWLCHRDRLAVQGSGMLFAACVLYLFHNPALGGTSFFRPRQSVAETEALVADSQAMPAADFSRRYGLQPGYMDGSNAYFEQVAHVGAAWNRVVFYDGSLFHTAEVGPAQPLAADPRAGRLTLNAFITCRLAARG
jgi:hypothetical protein